MGPGNELQLHSSSRISVLISYKKKLATTPDGGSFCIANYIAKFVLEVRYFCFTMCRVRESVGKTMVLNPSREKVKDDVSTLLAVICNRILFALPTTLVFIK